MKKNALIITLVLCFVGEATCTAQILQRKVSLKKQIKNSSLVIEGEVIEKTSFWDVNTGLIYTANTVEVHKVFKGEPIKMVDVITLGGTVNLTALSVNSSLKLYRGDTGVFTLKKSNVSNTSKYKNYRPYSSSQGFYRYNIINDLAANSFGKKHGIETHFYNEIIANTNQSYIKIKNLNKVDIIKLNKEQLTPESITFIPAVVSAGTKDVLTISGTGFGTIKGKVGFSNADDGGVTFIDALDSQVLSWRDTQITVEIPSFAGTGKIRVTNGENPTPTSAVSSEDLTISYAEINLEGNFGEGEKAYQVQHFNQNGSGGYTWEMFTDFFDDSEHSGAKDAFERAFNNWVCETGINWEISTLPTTTDVIGVADLIEPFDEEIDPEGVNVIRFDNGTELEDITMTDNVLGACFSWYSICLSSPVKVVVSELDIVFNDDIDNPDTPASESWYFGNDPEGISTSEIDFESVALHELGHGHQLGHVIDVHEDGNNLDDIMHFKLSSQEYQRVIGGYNNTAASHIQTRSETSTTLCASLMSNASCPLNLDEESLEKTVSIYPNPTVGQFNIQNISYINLVKVEIYDVSGRQIFSNDLSNSTKLKTINMVGVSSGIYYVNIFSDRAMITKKLILE